MAAGAGAEELQPVGMARVEPDGHLVPPNYVDSPSVGRGEPEESPSFAARAAASVAVAADKLPTLPDATSPSTPKDEPSTSTSDAAETRLRSTTASAGVTSPGSHDFHAETAAEGGQDHETHKSRHESDEGHAHEGHVATEAAASGQQFTHYGDGTIEVHGDNGFIESHGDGYLGEMGVFDRQEAAGQTEPAAIAAVAAAAAASRYTTAYAGLETRITWADQNGKPLAEVFYSENLHYSSDWAGDDTGHGSACCSVM